ncbi:MAG: hypothetical protein KY464_03210 [Gemmatimonadetes bacterium]|nr:hypothetical protein [Gemmatimonadota bacterium]
MIGILLRDLRWRVLLVFLVALVLYFLEPAFHQHDVADPEFAEELGPIGVSATLAYLAGLAMIVLLAGFVSSDRREGYAQMYFSQPTSPLAFYALRWVLAFAIAIIAAVAFLIVGQFVAWGGARGGGSGLLLPLLTASVYGGIMAFLSVALPRGDAWVAFILFLPTFFPQVLDLLQTTMPPGAYRLLLFALPPQTALQDVYQGLLLHDLAWGSVVFVLGYSAAWLIAATLMLRFREWA